MDPNDSEYYRQHGQFEPYPPTSSTAIDFSTMSTTVSENSPNYNPYSSPVVQNTGNYITTSSSGFAPTEPTVSSMASPDYGGNAAHYRHPQHQQPQTFMPQQQQGFMPQQQTQGFAPQQPQGFASQQPQGFMPQQQQGYPPQQQQFGFPMSGVVSDPMMQNIAMQYGNTMLGQGKQVVAQSVEKYISLSRIKYYFAVDSAYVSRKIRLLFFPFTNSDWSVRYCSEEPIQPRHEVNSPDLYIPCMAFVTYIVMAGFMLGRQQRFSPELLGMQFSSALAWLLFEMLLVQVSVYVLNASIGLRALDLLAFSGYKYVGINLCLLSSLFLDRTGYLLVMLYVCSMCALFLVRTLKVQLQPPREDSGGAPGGVKRRTYLLLLMSSLQPLLIFWLCYHLVQFPSPPVDGSMSAL